MATLVSDIITQAFLDLGVIAPGETISAAMQADAFLRLRQMYASWSTERATVNTVHHYFTNVTAGLYRYTLGLTGTLTTTFQPVRVTSWASEDVNLLYRTGGPVITFEEFATRANNPSGRESKLAEIVAADNAYPNINLWVYPTPSGTPGVLFLDCWAPLADFAAVGDALALAPGYEDALHFNLAVALYPQYPRSVGIDPALAQNAQNSKASIVALNSSINIPQAPQQAA